MKKPDFISAFGYSLFITVFSVGTIVLFTSMTAWCITRVKSRVSSILYYLLVFSMIVPFQMVMFTMSKMANILHLDNPIGIIVLYLGFGAGLSVFIYSGFVKSIPLEIEEAATMDGCNPIQTFFLIVMPILQPVSITVAILNTMWVWNDYLLPYLVIGTQLQDDPDRRPVPAGRLRQPRHGRDDGDAGAGDHPDRHLLSDLPAIHHQGRGGRSGQGLMSRANWNSTPTELSIKTIRTSK